MRPDLSWFPLSMVSFFPHCSHLLGELRRAIRVPLPYPFFLFFFSFEVPRAFAVGRVIGFDFLRLFLSGTSI